jgi:hypothetical protein
MRADDEGVREFAAIVALDATQLGRAPAKK